MLFFKRGSRQATEMEIGVMKERVQRIREQMGEHDVSLCDLFGFLGEERAVRAIPQAPSEPVIERVLPGQVPALPHALPQAEDESGVMRVLPHQVPSLSSIRYGS